MLIASGSSWAGPATYPADKKGAEAYLAAVLSMVDSVQKDLPALSHIADEAAKLYVENDDLRLGIAGSHAFVLEIRGRSGGLMQLEDLYVPKHDWKGIVLYALRADDLEEDAFFIRYFRNTGSKVIVFARPFLIDRAEKRFKLEYDWKIPTPAAWSGGLFELGNRWLVPTDEVADMIAGWAWCAEFAGACTRLGKMPPLYQGWVFGGMARGEKLKDVRFHPEKPHSVPALQAGQAYLDEQRKSLQAIGAQEMQNVRKVAAMAIAARDAHKGVYAFVEGHASIWAFGGPYDAGFFTQAGYWTELRRDITLEKGDLLFGLGYAGMMQGEKFAKLAERCRELGVKLAWTYSSEAGRLPATSPVGDVDAPEGEVVIDQHWSYGDSVVQFPGYDIKVIPVSGVDQLTVLQMVSAEILAQRPDQATAKK